VEEDVEAEVEADEVVAARQVEEFNQQGETTTLCSKETQMP
jgi:hypothetical protein